MTTHELAALLDSLRSGLVDWFGVEVRRKFVAAAEGLRELPDEAPKTLAERVRKSDAVAAGAGTGTGSGTATGGSHARLIESIRAARAGGPLPEGTRAAVEKLTVPQLDQVLTAFGQKKSGNRPDKLARAVALLGPSPDASAAPVTAAPAPAFDPVAVEEGVRIFVRLRDDRTLPITQVKAGFEPLRAYPKPVIEEISRRLEYTPDGSVKEVAERLWRNLEGIKSTQYRSEMILTGA